MQAFDWTMWWLGPIPEPFTLVYPSYLFRLFIWPFCVSSTLNQNGFASQCCRNLVQQQRRLASVKHSRWVPPFGHQSKFYCSMMMFDLLCFTVLLLYSRTILTLCMSIVACRFLWEAFKAPLPPDAQRRLDSRRHMRFDLRSELLRKLGGPVWTTDAKGEGDKQQLNPQINESLPTARDIQEILLRFA